MDVNLDVGLIMNVNLNVDLIMKVNLNVGLTTDVNLDVNLDVDVMACTCTQHWSMISTPCLALDDRFITSLRYTTCMFHCNHESAFMGIWRTCTSITST